MGLLVHRFIAEKRCTAQLSAHPLPYLRAQVIVRTAMVGRTEGCNDKRVTEDVARLIYLYTQAAPTTFT